MLFCVLGLLALLLVAFVAQGDAGEKSLVREQQAAADRLPQLREEVRAILTNRCGNCHNSTLSRENAAALKIFDLKDSDWSAGMSDGQGRKLISRTESFGGTERERGRVSSFVDAELESRKNRKR